jgi:hypothetical protein
MASAFNVVGLVNYIEENAFPLMAGTVNKAKMMNLVEVIPNVKTPTKLPLLSQAVYFQADGCSFDASGTTVFTQRTLTPGKFKVNVEWCPKDLETKFFATKMKAGSHMETVEPAEVFAKMSENLLEKVGAEIDKYIWQGSVSAPTANNGAFWDGFITTIGSGYINANLGGTPLTTAFTATNAQEMAFRLYNSLATNGLTEKSDLIGFVGYDTYAVLVQALVVGGSTYGTVINAGVKGSVDTQSAEGLIFNGINLKFIPVAGLTGTNKVYAGSASQFFIGVDAESDFSSLEVWYSKDDRKVKAALEMKVGTQVAFPAEIAAIVL